MALAQLYSVGAIIGGQGMILPRLLILSFTDAGRDPRVYRQALFLREKYTLTLAGLADPKIDNVEFLPILRVGKGIINKIWQAVNLLLGNTTPAQNRFQASKELLAKAGQWDVVLVNDAEPLPLGFFLAKRAPVVFDAHEYYPKEFEDSLVWRIFFQRYLTGLCREFIPRCAGMTTVCSGIAKEYQSAFGVTPEVIYSGPEYQKLPVNLVQPERIRLIHHGSASPDRCIERMINCMSMLDSRFSLDLYLVGKGRYFDKLKWLAQATPNVSWHDPVPMDTLSRVSNTFDVGVFLVPPSTFNLQHCLPNKFFEFIQARLAIAIGPSPEMASIVDEYGLGIVADDFTSESLARKLNGLTTEDIMRFKQNSEKAACVYNAEESMKVLKFFLRTVLR